MIAVIKQKNHGSATVEYSLVMAIVVTLVIVAAQAMSPNLENFFEAAATRIENFLDGGGHDSNRPAEATTSSKAASGGGEDSGGGFWNGVWGGAKQVGGVFKGFGEATWDTAVGLGTLAYDVSRLGSPIAPILEIVDPEGQAEIRDKYVQVGKAIWNNPGDVAYTIVEPIVTDWENGNYGEAFGRGIFEVASAVVTPTKLGKAGKIGDVAEDVASAANAVDNIASAGNKIDDVANAGNKIDDVGDASSVANRIDDILPNGRVPGNRNGEFSRWFDDLSPDDLDTLWADDAIRKQIEDRIRYPGSLHEWCMACRAPTFKRGGVSMEEIKRFRTGTEDLKWIHPDDGLPGGHGGHGSGKFHNELRDIIDNSSSVEEFNRGVVELRDRWQIDPELLPPLIEG